MKLIRTQKRFKNHGGKYALDKTMKYTTLLFDLDGTLIEKERTAQEALDMGLVNKVVPLEQLEEEYVQWAEEMMLHSPLALRMIKAGLNAELDGQAGIQELAGDATMLYYMTEEAQEGGKAFLEKRRPRFEDYPKFP